jgi:uncharacterized membrane protein YhhN
LHPLLYVFLCAAYLLLLARTPSPVAAALKILPILLLVGRASLRGEGRPRIYLALGLVSSLAGDLILALAPGPLFVHGVAAFLVAHVFYIAAFWPRVRSSRRGALFTALVVAWCAAIGWVVFPHLGALRVPVVAYMGVITAMGVCAAFATGPHATLFVGAFAFIVSDSIIALDRFVMPFANAPYLVMTTYYLGQFLIVHGVIDRRAAARA